MPFRQNSSFFNRFHTKKMWTKIYLWIKFAIYVILLCNEQTQGLRILGLFPLNGKSHYVICDRLMKGLAEKGHQVDVYSHFPSKRPIKNLKDYSLEGSLPELQNNLTYEKTMQLRLRNIRLAISTLGTNLCDLMSLPVFQDLLKNPPHDPPYDVVIVEVRL